jgi:response regulator RpfG family c-di-GMP phosphodiesterase
MTVTVAGKVASTLVSNRSSRSFRVLVVDDLRSMRIVTQQLLEMGHDVQVAEIGQLALESLMVLGLT